MSLKTIKNTLEAHLQANLTDVAIKYNNTNYYVKNGTKLTDTEVDNLKLYVEARIIPIDSDRELISSSEPFKTICFFQIDIYDSVGSGTGDALTTIETLDSIFREQTIDSVVCKRTVTIGSFTEGEWVVTPHRVTAFLWG